MDNEYAPVQIGGKTDIPLDVLVTTRSADAADEYEDIGCIMQRVKQLTGGGFFSKAHAVITLLVPENRIEQFRSISARY